jgi:hypothetical protein
MDKTCPYCQSQHLIKNGSAYGVPKWKCKDCLRQTSFKPPRGEPLWKKETAVSASLLRLAAVTGGRTDTALGAFFRRLSGRVGKAKAVTTTARKIAVLFYNTLRYGMDYADPGASYYEERYQQRVLANLQRRAKSLGYVLQQADAAPATNGVS